jgi:hypothetical protein
MLGERGAPGRFDELEVPSLSRDGRALPSRSYARIEELG